MARVVALVHSTRNHHVFATILGEINTPDNRSADKLIPVPADGTVRVAFVNAHNGYLDILLTLGPVGLFLAFGFLFQSVVFIGKIRTLNKPLYQFSLFVVVFVMVHNLTDSNLVRGVSCLWIILIIIAYASAKQYRLQRETHEPRPVYAFA